MIFIYVLYILFLKIRYPDINQVVIRGFIGTVVEAEAYLTQGYYIGLTGFLCKVSLIPNFA